MRTIPYLTHNKKAVLINQHIGLSLSQNMKPGLLWTECKSQIQKLDDLVSGLM